LKPGFVDTPMTAQMAKTPLFAQPAAVGRGIVRALDGRGDVVYLPWYWRFIMLILRLIPEPIFKRMAFLIALLEAMRPRPGSKNVFVFAGIVFAGLLFDVRSELRVVAVFFVFCAAASSVYLANDIADRESDAHHPIKKQRPIASARLSPRTAAVASALLAAA